MSNDLELYGELRATYQSIEHEGKQEDFISFLHYCADRLEKGATVQEIWNDYVRRVQSTA